MLTATEQQENNLALARQINRETRADPSSLYAGKYLGIWHEQVVAVADDLNALEAELQGMQADGDCVVIEASADYDTPIMIW